MKREHPLPKVFKIRSQSSGLDILPTITLFSKSVASNFHYYCSSYFFCNFFERGGGIHKKSTLLTDHVYIL